MMGAPAELWAIRDVGLERPVRLRLLDLPFTAVEWVLHADISQPPVSAREKDFVSWMGGGMGGSEVPPTARFSSPGRPHLGTVSPPITPSPGIHSANFMSPMGTPAHPQTQPPAGANTSTGGGAQSPGPATGAPHPWVDDLPEELLAFTLGDGRAGVLSVMERHEA
eukprot:gene3896-13966_t